jgi:ABC-type dipeptide/oligopeptide/nickel transport system permease component
MERSFSGAKLRLWQVFANINVLAVNLAYIVCGVFVFKTVFPYSGLDKLLIDGVVSWEIVVVSPAQCFSVWFM